MKRQGGQTGKVVVTARKPTDRRTDRVIHREVSLPIRKKRVSYIRNSEDSCNLRQEAISTYYFFTGLLRDLLSTRCSLNIVFFQKILEYSGLWPISVFPRCQCVYTHQAGRTPALQQNWKSSENHKQLNIQ